MKMQTLATAIGLVCLTATAASALDLVALTDRNELLRFSSDAPGKTTMIAVLGTSAPLLGIDVRPADAKLYGLAADGSIYRIDMIGGIAEKVAMLSVALENGQGALVDFNPQADRMRVIGPSGQDLRVNVDTGQAAVDGRIAYLAGDANAGKKPTILAGAYINSVPGAKQTQLFEFDSAQGTYVIQDPPNDGTLSTIAAANLPAGTSVDAVDIHTDKGMQNYTGFAIAAGRLWEFSVTNGKLREIGPVAAGTRKIRDIAVVSPP